MRLSEEEYNKYLEIHPRLILYVGKRKKIIPDSTTFDEFMNYSVEEKYPARNAMYENIHMLKDYIKEHSDSLTEEDKDIIRAFKYFKQGRFYIVKLTKKNAHFLGDKFVYGVHALSDPFQIFFGNNLPTMVQTVLLPFKGKLIYDGIMSTYSISFGRGISSSIKNDYALSQGRYGIITELPEKISKSQTANGLEKELLVMMKTKSSREHNWYRIEDLLQKNPELEPIYIREWGRINAGKKKKELRSLGIQKRWFAMVNDTIISSGNSEKELKGEIGKLILDPNRRRGVYYFKV